jgi:hypothetical protein
MPVCGAAGRMLAQGHGAIVNIGSAVIVRGGAQARQYRAAKYGLLGVTKSYADAFAPTVRVNFPGKEGFTAADASAQTRYADVTDSSLSGDLVAALREHGSEALDEHAVTGANPADGSLRFRHYVAYSPLTLGNCRKVCRPRALPPDCATAAAAATINSGVQSGQICPAVCSDKGDETSSSA